MSSTMVGASGLGQRGVAIPPLRIPMGDFLSSDMLGLQQLSQDMGRLQDSTLFADVTLMVDGTRFRCHRCILASRSEPMRALLCNGFRETGATEIVIGDATSAAFRSLLLWMYTGRYDPNEHALEVLALADRFALQQLKTVCEECLVDSLDDRNCCRLYEEAVRYGAARLASKAREWIERNAVFVLPTAAVEDLSYDSLYALLSLTELAAEGHEFVLFTSVLRWAQHHLHLQLPSCTAVAAAAVGSLSPSAPASGARAPPSEPATPRRRTLPADCVPGATPPVTPRATAAGAGNTAVVLEAEQRAKLESLLYRVRYALMSPPELRRVRDLRIVSADVLLDALLHRADPFPTLWQWHRQQRQLRDGAPDGPPSGAPVMAPCSPRTERDRAPPSSASPSPPPDALAELQDPRVTPRAPVFCWDAASCPSHVQLSERQTVATITPVTVTPRPGGAGPAPLAMPLSAGLPTTALVLGSRCMESGVYSWEVQVLAGERTVIGVFCEGSGGGGGGGLTGWAVQTGRLVQDGLSLALPLAPVAGPGDVITVTLNLDTNQLLFCCNGISLRSPPIRLQRRRPGQPVLPAVEISSIGRTAGRVRIRSTRCLQSDPMRSLWIRADSDNETTAAAAAAAAEAQTEDEEEQERADEASVAA